MKSFVRKIIITCSAVVALLSVTPTQAGTHVWTGNGLTKNWNNANNWSGGVPQANEAAPVILEFPAGLTGAVTNNIANLVVDELRMLSSGFIIRGTNGVSLTLRGGNTFTNLYSAGINSIDDSMPLALQGNVRVMSPVLLYLSSAISGSGGLTINGGVRFDGRYANSYAGTTVVQSGVVTLDKFFFILNGGFGVVSIPGPLFIEAGTVAYSSDNGVSDTAVVQIESGGVFSLSGYDDTIGGLTLIGAHASTSAGTLIVDGPFFAEGVSTLSGKLSLGGVGRTVEVELNSTLDISATILDGGNGLSHPGLVKKGEGVLHLSSANSYSGGTTVSEGTLEITQPFALGSAAFGGTTVQTNAVLSLMDGTIVSGESLTLNEGTLHCDLDGAWGGPITLNGKGTFESDDAGHELAITGVISGHGDLICNGLGRVTLAGTNSNTFTGWTRVNGGWLYLAKSGGAVAVPAMLSIGGILHTNNADAVYCQEPNQFSPTSAVVIARSGKLYLNSGTTVIGALSLLGGEVDTDNGTLVLNGDVTSYASSEKSIIDGKLSLGNATRTFNVDLAGLNPDLEINAIVSGTNGAGLTLTGGGQLSLTAHNTYPGLTTLNHGWLLVYHAHALGDNNPLNFGNETIINNGTSLSLISVVGGAEKLVFNGSGNARLVNPIGNNTWSGPIVMNSACLLHITAPLSLYGAMSGPGGFVKTGNSELTINGSTPNTFTGPCRVDAGRLVLAKPPFVNAIAGDLTIGDHGNNAAVEEVLLANDEQIANTVGVTIRSTGRLDLGNNHESFNELLGTGEVVLGYGKLSVARGDFSGLMSGLLGKLAKTGAETLALNGTNTYTGDTLVQGGTMLVNGSTANSTFYVTNNAVLGGNGSVGSIHLDKGSLAPGGVNSCGKLTGKGTYLKQNSTLVVELNGEIPVTQHDQYVSPNVVQLQGKLRVKLNGNTASGDTFVIVKKDGAGLASGTFSGLPEGQMFYVNSRSLQITYQGGDGNDVVLRQTGQTILSQVTGVSTSPNGNPVVSGTGIPFQLYNVERSFDLQTWEVLDTVAANDAGTISYEDPDGYSHPKAFYRFMAVDDSGQL